MPASAAEIRAIAAKVYDDVRELGTEYATQAELAFLAAVNRADDECHETICKANIQWGVSSDAFQAVRNLANRQCEAELVKALAALEAADDLEFTQEAAE